MTDRTLADLAQEYEESGRILEEQIASIDKKIKVRTPGVSYHDLCRRRACLEEMLYEVKQTTRILKTYYD